MSDNKPTFLEVKAMEKQIEEMVNEFYRAAAEEFELNGEDALMEEIDFHGILRKAFPNYVFAFDGKDRWIIVSTF